MSLNYFILLKMKKIKDKFINLQKFKLRYNRKCYQWKDEPVEKRNLQDPICIIILIILTSVFIYIGSYCIQQYNENIFYYQSTLQLNQNLNGNDEYLITKKFFKLLSDYKFQLMGLVLFSNMLAILYIYLLKIASKLVIFLMIIISMASLLRLEYGYMLGGMAQKTSISIVGGVIILYPIIVICYRNQIKIGIVLIKMAGAFMLQKKIIFIAIFIKAALTFAFSMYWIYVFLCVFSSYLISQFVYLKETETQKYLMSYWSIMFGFYTLLLYYFSVFNIAVIFAYWYYDSDQKFPLLKSWKWILRYSLGSLTFAALLVSITKLFCSVLDSSKKYSKNIPALICIECVKCIFKQAANILQAFNHNAVICMALTGQCFTNSARTTLGVVGEQFAVISIISKLIYMWGFLVSVLAPTLIANLAFGKSAQQSMYISWIVFYFSSLITGLILAIFNESLTCVIFFYCLDKRFRDVGLKTHKIPIIISQALEKSNFQVSDSYMIIRS